MHISFARPIRITRLASSALKAKHFALLIACLGLLPLRGGLAVSAAAQSAERLWKLDVPSQAVEVRHADGHVSSGEFLSEIVLLPDGTANGGWSLFEAGTQPTITLFRIFEGRVATDERIGPLFTFRAQKLTAPVGESITITLQPAPANNGTSKGQWKLTVQDAASQNTVAHELLSFVAEASVRNCRNCIDADVTFGHISAPAQTVVVQTLRGSYTANFENVALVFPGGRASGLLVLSRPDGALLTFQVVAGLMQVRDDTAIVSVLVARGIPRAGSAAGDEITIILHPSTDHHQEDLIYDILGTQVGPAHFKATGVQNLYAPDLPSRKNH